MFRNRASGTSPALLFQMDSRPKSNFGQPRNGTRMRLIWFWERARRRRFEILISKEISFPLKPLADNRNERRRFDLTLAIVGTQHDSTQQIQRQQHLAPLLWSLIKIILKSQEEDAKAPDDSKINHQKSRIRLTRLYANSDPCLIQVHPIFKVLHFSKSVSVYV